MPSANSLLGVAAASELVGVAVTVLAPPSWPPCSSDLLRGGSGLNITLLRCRSRKTNTFNPNPPESISVNLLKVSPSWWESGA